MPKQNIISEAVFCNMPPEIIYMKNESKLLHVCNVDHYRLVRISSVRAGYLEGLNTTFYL